MVFRSLPSAFASALLIAVLAFPASSSAARLEDFFGTYKGQSVTEGPNGFEARLLDLKIMPKEEGDEGEGFVVEWETAIPRADGTYKYNKFHIHFRPTELDNVYRSAMRRDMFGNQVPLDPFKGEPFFWSTLSGDTLTVYGLIITPEGAYEVQAYERTLTDTGLDLRFYRVRDGEQTKVVEGELVRVKE
jgi:hypothetical protein